MNKVMQWINLALRSIIFLYIPAFILVQISYQAIFGASMKFHWVTALSYAILLVNWFYSKYKKGVKEEKITEYSHLESLLLQNNWEMIDRRRDLFVVRPLFNVPFNIFINDKVEIQYRNQIATIEGPLHYITVLSQTIQGKSNKKKWRLTQVSKVIFSTIVILIPFVMESGILWEMSVMRHNVEASRRDAEVSVQKILGTSVENSNNNGLGVENDEHIFYIHNGTALVKTDKELNFEEVILQTDNYYWHENLNLVGDWLYYTSEESLYRIKTDGTDNQVLYDLGYIRDVHVTGEGIYFINFEDDFNVYRMDLNGQNVNRIMNVQAKDIALYEDELLVSHDEVVVRMSLDGNESEVILNESATDLVKHDDHYYYIGSDNKLYKHNGKATSEPEIMVDRPIGTYTLTDDKIIFTLQSDYDIHPSHGIHLTDHTGTPGERIYASSYTESLTKVGDSIIFTTPASYGSTEVKRYNLTDGQVSGINLE